MERFAPLSRDPLRLGGAELPARALRRLETAAVRSGPLRTGGHGLAALTRARLDALISPPTGDEALAAALARAASALAGTTVEPRVADRSRRHIGDAVPERTRPVRPASHRRERVAPTQHGRAPLTPEQPVGPALAALIRNAEGTQETRPAIATPGMRRRAASPRAFEDPAEAHGLEWLAARVAGGAEASETPLVDGLPEAERSSSARVGTTAAHARRATEPRRPVAAAGRDEPIVPSPSAGADRATPVARPAPRTSGALLPHGGGAGELEALVRAWQGTAESPEQAAELPAPPSVGPPPAVAEVGSGIAAAVRQARPAGRARLTDSPARDEDATVFADAFGRLLVDELRRYGIEVDEG